MAVLTTGRLPVRLTPLVGRDAELAAIIGAARQSRLLTLTGPGGTGKTRLALAASAALAAEAGDGAIDVAWVELAPLYDPHVVAPAVAARLGVPDQPGTDPAEAIAAHLAARRDQKVLVVLDNCEHLAEAVAVLTEYLLVESPALFVLATSREPLGVEGERSWPVPPLGQQQAVQLFSDRARLVAPGFSVTDANKAKVEELCGKLDGLPLAIELAAARMGILSVRQLSGRLDDVFGVLRGGARSAPARHQALRATLDWSHDLLTKEERIVFRRLAAFVDGFELAAAETVASFGDINPGQVLDLVARLADKSLLRADHEADRYHMLATIREYASEKLAEAGERDLARRAHLAYYTDFAERAGARLELAHAAAADLEAELDGLDAERANLRAATDFASASGDAEAALRIVGQLGKYAYLRGHYNEIRQWMDVAVAAAGPAAQPRLRARALYGSGRLAQLQCDYEPAVRRLDAALLLYRELGDGTGTASCLQALGSVAREQGRYVRSAQLHMEGLQLAKAAADEWAQASAHSYLGFVSWLQGDFETALAQCTDALSLFRALRDVEGTAWSLISLGVIARYQGDRDQAAMLLTESLELSRSIGFREGLAWCEEQLGLVALAGGAVSAARARLRASYAMHRQLRDRWRMASVLADLAAAELASASGQPDASQLSGTRAAYLLGVAQALREAIGTVLAPCERGEHERTVAAARAALGDAAFEAARELGLRAPDPDEALGDPPSGEPGSGEPQPTPATAAMPVLVTLAAAAPPPLAVPPLAAPAPAAPAPAPVRAAARGPVARVTGEAGPAQQGARPPLTVRALGTAAVQVGDVELTAADWGYAKPRELLFLLVTSPPQTREQLGAALWPDLSRHQLGNALHTALRELRRALGDPAWVLYSGGRYAFNRALPHDCDVDAFESALAAASRARPASAALPDLQRAVAAYGGDFLAGMAAGEWAHARRDELRRRFESALLAVGRMHMAAGRYEAAVTAFRRAIEHEPLNEVAHRELMTCWAQLGQTARATRHYTDLIALLADQAGVRPATETTALYERLAGQS
ncbi:MAG: BTAD domain-containing putative transcriptional regulator [Trebonia sp.]|jgi:predicted ATPase/DNA-binding SARP family transcriptional activator